MTTSNFFPWGCSTYDPSAIASSLALLCLITKYSPCLKNVTYTIWHSPCQAAVSLAFFAMKFQMGKIMVSIGDFRNSRHNMLRDIMLGSLSEWSFHVDWKPRVSGSHRGDLVMLDAQGQKLLDVYVSDHRGHGLAQTETSTVGGGLCL
eukprot:gb/GECG01009234.1/.p1 GENE.gb/GECG01009234.1/~~gb/GECG01009234.1/.p1  ORF type:complete len:148 (+),score=1.89 gb/GECG01009234.1/:1-444(+)